MIIATKSQTRWIVPEINEPPQELGVEDFVLAQLLLQRGILTRTEAEKFLDPNLADLADPLLLDGMAEATKRIKRAVAVGEKITIYGDYDVDGVTSATLLRQCLAELGAEAEVYLPERTTEGYGINKEAVERLAAQGTSLMISVDTGTTAVAEIALAKALGMDVIVVDHHHVPSTLPDALAVINPHRPGQAYPCSDLAAVGVTYRLACALVGDKANQWLDLVALGTVADVVPLVGENRTLTVFGLMALNQTANIGIRALVDVAGLADKKLEVYHIGFQLGPRLNAAGRIDHASVAYQLLNTADVAKAHALAKELNALNARRQEMTDNILKSACTLERQWANEKMIIVENEGWSVGVVGIVAGRLVEKYSKPAIVFEQQDDVLKGSARSVDGVHIVELLDEVAEWLVGYGGHAKAAGITVAKTNYDKFKRALLQVAHDKIDENCLSPSVNVALTLDVGLVTDRLLATVEQMAPFGFGNPTPVFGVEGVTLEKIDTFGFGSTLIKMMFKDTQGKATDVIGFDKDGELLLRLTRGQKYNVAFTMSINEFKGKRFRQQKLVDLQTAV
ncbi:MAG: single-stranded-DNA-specific exonuclease RecJ [Patescibacteria group bacterium]|nr:single-stranded-DNA-specific exonuclease RecJ [Patescibacteria group bacterium]